MAKIPFDPTPLVDTPERSRGPAEVTTSKGGAVHHAHDRYEVSASRPNVRRANTLDLADPEKWGAGTNLAYGLYAAFVWPVRRVTVSRANDAREMVEFLDEGGIVHNGKVTASVSDRYLVKIGVQRRFWWLDKTQVERLAETLSRCHNQDNPKARPLQDAIHAALFNY